MKSKIKTFEDACNALNINPETSLPEVTMLPEKHQKAVVALTKLIIIAEALNEGWQPDWSDSTQWKYYPWFDMEDSVKQPSGSGLSFFGYADGRSFSVVGSRLAYKSRELARYAGKQFAKEYADYFLIN